MTIAADAGVLLRPPPIRNACYLIRLSLMEARPIVQVMFGLRFLCGSAIALTMTPASAPLRIVAGLFAWQCAIVFTYLLNGVMDITEDRVNGSCRPIARGALSLTAARRVVVGSAVVGIASGIAGPVVAVLVAVLMLLGYLYSGPPWFLKRTATGTLAVLNLAGLLSYTAGLFAAGGRHFTETGLICAIAMSLWTGLISSTTKDLPDVAGDAAAGRRTAAVRFGERPVRRLAAALGLLLAAAFLAAAIGAAPMAVPPAVATQLGAVLLAVVCLGGAPPAWLARRLRAGSRRRGRQPYQAFMLTQYATHLCMLGSAAAICFTR